MCECDINIRGSHKNWINFTVVIQGTRCRWPKSNLFFLSNFQRKYQTKQKNNLHILKSIIVNDLNISQSVFMCFSVYFFSTDFSFEKKKICRFFFNLLSKKKEKNLKKIHKLNSDMSTTFLQSEFMQCKSRWKRWKQRRKQILRINCFSLWPRIVLSAFEFADDKMKSEMIMNGVRAVALYKLSRR